MRAKVFLSLLLTIFLIIPSFAATNVSSCMTLSTPHEIYTLNQSVNSAGTCFNITANNITLNCQGYSINYSQISLGFAVNLINYNQTTIKNCQFYDTGIDNSFAIYFNNAKDGKINNNSFSLLSNSSLGVYLRNSSDSTTISRFMEINLPVRLVLAAFKV